MNDPHVVALFYRVGHDNSVDYSNTKPLLREGPEFRLKVETEMASFEFTKHYATENAARKAVEDYIHAWEFDACLENGTNYFKLIFDRAQIEDRNPTPGATVVPGSALRSEVTISEAVPTVSPAHYPSQPSGLKITPDVQTLYDRYMGYLQGKEHLPSMANFCLTILEGSTEKKNSRKVAAETYGIKLEVLKKIGQLCANKGGKEARKAAGKDEELTTQDRRFLEKAIKAVIRRAAERAHDSDGDLPQISMSGLPAPSSESHTKR